MTLILTYRLAILRTEDIDVNTECDEVISWSESDKKKGEVTHSEAEMCAIHFCVFFFSFC